MSNPKPGKYYCDKAPGHSWLGVVPAWFAIKVLHLPPHPVRKPAMTDWPTDRFITWGTNGVLTAATATLIFLIFVHCGVSQTWSSIGGLVYGISTIALPNAVTFYGHASAGFFALLCFWFLFVSPPHASRALLAGFAAGCSVVCEYTLASLVVTTLLALLMDSLGTFRKQPGWGRLFGFIAGGLVPAAALMYYHYAVTGSPFTFPYQFEVLQIFEYHAQGVPIGIASPDRIAELLWGNRRGILWYSPVLLAAIPGAIVMVKRGLMIPLFVCLGTFVGLLVLIAGFPSWHGGWCTGPRFLLPAFPLLFVPIGFWLSEVCKADASSTQRIFKWCWVLLAGASELVIVACTIVGPQIPQDIPNPLVNVIYPAINAPPKVNILIRFDSHIGDLIVLSSGIDTKTRIPGMAVTIILMALAASLPIAFARWFESHKRLE